MSEEARQEAADLRAAIEGDGTDESELPQIAADGDRLAAENQWLWGEVTRFSQWQARTERLRASTYEMLVRAQGEANAAEAERDRLAGIVERVKALAEGYPPTASTTPESDSGAWWRAAQYVVARRILDAIEGDGGES